jgi:hypothetical protein
VQLRAFAYSKLVDTKATEQHITAGAATLRPQLRLLLLLRPARS